MPEDGAVAEVSEEDIKADKKAAQEAAREAKKAVKEAKKAAKEAAKAAAEADEQNTIGSKIAVALVTVLIIVIWLAILALLIHADVGGVGTMLRPVLRNVPVLNRILPVELDENGEPIVREADTEEDPYHYASMEEAVDYIKELERSLAEAQEKGSDNDAYVAELEAEVAKLRIYEQQQIEFEAEKQKFYEEVVFSDNAPGADAYVEYYKSIDPVNAEALYKQAVRQQEADQELKDYVAKYSNMKAKNAAAIFDTMTSDFQLVAKILRNMDNQAASDILAAMSTENAAILTEILNPPAAQPAATTAAVPEAAPATAAAPETAAAQ